MGSDEWGEWRRCSVRRCWFVWRGGGRVSRPDQLLFLFETRLRQQLFQRQSSFEK